VMGTRSIVCDFPGEAKTNIAINDIVTHKRPRLEKQLDLVLTGRLMEEWLLIV